jgi:hypothetical protein
MSLSIDDSLRAIYTTHSMSIVSHCTMFEAQKSLFISLAVPGCTFISDLCMLLPCPWFLPVLTIHRFMSLSLKKKNTYFTKSPNFRASLLCWQWGQDYEHQVQREVGREDCFSRNPKKNSEPTQNWCCQSIHAEGYTEVRICMKLRT